MLAKLEAAMAVKRDTGSTSFVINARTDALKATEDRRTAQDLAIRRANSYLEAGADLCFIPYVKTREEVALFAREVKGPLSIAAGLPYNIREFSINDCRDLGVARVSIPTCVAFSAIQGMLKMLTLIHETGRFDEATRQDMLLSDMAVLDDLLGPQSS